MVSKLIRKFCKNPEKIENYDKAISDTTQTWHCHHRLELYTLSGEKRPKDLYPRELIALGMYYNRPPEELIFLTPSDHISLHRKSRKSVKTSGCVFRCFGKERYTDKIASTTKLAAYLSQYTDKDASVIYQQILRAYKKTAETGKAHSFKIRAKESLLNNFTIDPDPIDNNGNIIVYVSGDDNFDVTENKVENITDNMAEYQAKYQAKYQPEYQKVNMWIRRNPGKTNFPKKWSEENIALAKRLLSK